MYGSRDVPDGARAVAVMALTGRNAPITAEANYGRVSGTIASCTEASPPEVSVLAASA